MKNFNPFPFAELPMDEIVAELQQIFPDLKTHLDLDAIEAEMQKRIKEAAEAAKLKTKRAPDNGGGGITMPPIPFSLQPLNLNDVDAPSMEHMQTIWSAIKEVALNTQAPGRMIVISALATFATIAQGLYKVRSPLGTHHPLSLNTIVIASSGERKTTVDNAFTKVFAIFMDVINGQIQELNQNIESRLDRWETDNKILKSEYRAAKKKGEGAWEDAAYEQHKKLKPQKLDFLAMVHDDYTVSALLQSLFCNMPVASIMSSEGAKVLDDANMKCVPFLNKLWDGAAVQVLRLARESFWLQDASLSTSLMIQPDVMKKILLKRYDELRSSGYFARALVCYPESNIGRRPVYATQRYSEKMDVLHTRLVEMLVDLLYALANPEFERKELVLDQEAEQMWLKFANDVESNMNPGCIYEAATDHASKMPENALRAAGVLHAVEFGDGEISAKTLHAAIQICLRCSKDFVDWFVPLPQDVQNGQRLQKYLHENYGVYLMNRPIQQMYFDERFVRRERVLRCGPMTNAEQLNQALGWLIRQGAIAVVEEIRPVGKGMVYIDLIPSCGLPPMSSNGFPLRYVVLN